MTLWFPDLPGPLGFLTDFLIGHWPEGDEDAMRRAAGHWSDMADALEQLQDPANQAMLAAQTNIDGRISDAMGAFWAEAAGGENSELHKLITLCRSYEDQLNQGATDIEYTKLTIYGSILVIAAMAFTPVGAIVDAVALNAVRFAIRMAVQKLIARLGVRGAAYAMERAALWTTVKVGQKVVDQTIAQTIAKQALIGASIGGGLDAAVQGGQLAGGGRDTFNFKSLFLSTGAGAVAGSIAGTLGERVAVGLAPGLTNSSALTQVATVGAAQIPGNLLGNAAAATAIGITTDRPIDLTAVSHGVGGGFIGKPIAAHGDSVVDAATQVGPAKDTGGAHAGEAQPAAAPRSDPADTVSAAAPVTEVAPNATVAANHGNQVVAQPDSAPANPAGSAAPASAAPASAAPTGNAPLSSAPVGGAPASIAPSGAAPAGGVPPSAASAGAAPNAALSGGSQSVGHPVGTGADRAPAPGGSAPAADRQAPSAPRSLPETTIRPETRAPLDNRTEVPPQTEAPRPASKPAAEPATADQVPNPAGDRVPDPAAPEHDPAQPPNDDRPGAESLPDENGPAVGEVVHDLDIAPEGPGKHRPIPERPEFVPTPEELTSGYLNQVLDEHAANPFERPRFETLEPEPFRAGSPDDELPSNLTRSMPEHALNEAVSPIDPDKIVVNYDGDGLVPMWRDQSPDNAYLTSGNALFRMDSRGPEIFGNGFAPRDPGNLNIGGHVGSGRPDGFVSLSRSPEHTILRDQYQVSAETLARMADAGEVERLPGGGYRQTRYMHELYTPHGIDVDATYHDASAHTRYQLGGHQEAEILAPGGISGDSIYRTWPRETTYDANGDVVSTRVGEPVHNPNFAHLDNPRFGTPHDSGDSIPTSNLPYNSRPAEESPPESLSPAPDSPHPVLDTPNPVPDPPKPIRLDTEPEPEPAPENNGAAPVMTLPRADSPPVQVVPHIPVHPDAAPLPTTPRTNPTDHAPIPQDSRAPDPRTPAPDPQPVQPNPHTQQAAPHAQQPAPHTQQPAPHAQQPTPHESRPAPQERGPADTAPPKSTPHPDIPFTQPNSHQPHAPSSRELHQAQQVRNAREWYRTQPPEHGRTTPVPTDRTPNAKPAYDFRRYPDAPGGPVAVTSIKVHVTFDGSVTPDHVAQVWEKAQLATDLAFNYGQPLLSGDRILVDLVHTPDPAAANLNIHVTDTPGPWHPANHPDAMAQQLREHLGLSPEPGRNGFGPEEIRQLSNDIAKANTPARFEGLENGHRFGRGRLQSLEDPAYQHAVEDALRKGNQFLVGADPRYNPYGQLINDGGPSQLGRGNNCLVGSLAAISSFHGDPQVGLARWPDQLPDGRIDTQTGEQAGLQRAEDFLGGSWENFNQHGLPLDKQFTALHDWVRDLGPGSSALVVNGWHATDPATGQPLFHPDGTPVISSTHATVIVFPHEAEGPVWWDPQAATYSAHPPKSLVEGSGRLMFMTNPSEAGAAHAPAGHPGTNPAVPGATLPHSPGMVDPSIPRRLDLPTETHPGADRFGAGTGPHEPADRFHDGSRDRVPELVDENGGGGLHPNQTVRPPADGPADLPTPNHDHLPTRTGEPGHDPIPGPHRNPDPTPDTTHRNPADNRQDHPGIPAHRVDDGESGVLDRLAPQPGRDLAEPGDVRGVAAPTHVGDDSPPIPVEDQRSATPARGNEPPAELTRQERAEHWHHLEDAETRNPTEFDQLQRDPDKNGRISDPSKDEARVGLDLRDQGRLPADIQRPAEADRGEFYSPSTGKYYDIKGVHSDWPPFNNVRDKSQPFKGAYDPASNGRWIEKLREQIEVKGRTVILDVRNANQAAIDDNVNIVRQNGWGDHVIWYP